jgi:TM2 domain-containing membrane protein YozV
MSRSPAPDPSPGIAIRLACSFLSSLIPGTGQLMAGYRRRGMVMLAISLLIFAAGIVIYMQGLSTIISWLVQPRILIAVFALNVIVLLFRLGSMLDAYRASGGTDDRVPGGWRGAITLLVLMLVLAVTVAPHAVLGYYTYLAHDALHSVFSAENLADLEPVSTPTADPTTAPDITPTPGEVP